VSIIPGEGKTFTWGNPVNLGRTMNTEGDEMFPFIDNDGSLWFASNGLPGLGGLDVFVARKNASGFAPPQNPGYKFNTRYDDFGYITRNSGKDGFISSDRNSRTGDDIFRVRRMTRNITVIVYDQATGRPIEGASVSVLQSGQAKAVAVPMGMGLGQTGLASGQAYTFTATAGRYNELKLSLPADKAETSDTVRLAMTRSEAEIFLEGTVLSASSKKPVPGAVARVTDLTATQTSEAKCDENGVFRLAIRPGTSYSVTASAMAAGNECSSGIAEISTRDINEDATISRAIPLYCVGDIIEVENIYYDLNKSAIRPEAAAELDKLYGIMMSNPYLKIELRSHTDSRGSASSNMSLSEKRADSAAEYLYSKGIAKERIASKGYGESLLLNKCADGVNCSEEEHQVNRRTEFKVLSLK
jgi:outer membrane protein OmpA-like peptidoglycan-associated protein